jgi:hypothetical protein
MMAALERGPCLTPLRLHQHDPNLHPENAVGLQLGINYFTAVTYPRVILCKT